MKILVTGASGYIGQRLSDHLFSQGYDLRLLVRNKSRLPQKLRDNCEVWVADATVPSTLDGCCQDIDIVFNLIALRGHDLPSEAAFAKFRKVNVEGLRNLVSEAKKSNIKRFIHLSGTAAMGMPEGTVNEETPCAPSTPFQVTKYEGEQLLLEEYRQNGFPVLILRPCMLYGPGLKGDFLTLSKLCKTGFFPKIGHGENLSPALHIMDLIYAFPKCIENGHPGEIYLLASERSYSLREVSQIIGKVLGKKIRYVYVPKGMMLFGAGVLEKTFHVIGRNSPVTERNIRSIVTDRVIDIHKACRDLQFQQTVPFETGLAETVRFYMQEHFI